MNDNTASYDHRAPALFLTWLEARHWRLSATDDGELQVRIGYDAPEMRQPQILALLLTMKPSLVAILRGLESVH